MEGERDREGRTDGEGEGVINSRGEKGTGRDGWIARERE